jgi:hypothetical protein
VAGIKDVGVHVRAGLLKRGDHVHAWLAPKRGFRAGALGVENALVVVVVAWGAGVDRSIWVIGWGCRDGDRQI